MKMNAIERTERREQIKATKAHLEIVVEVFKATREEIPAATHDELRSHDIYQPGNIHPAHINQIGEAMREYTPAEEIPAEEATEEEQRENTLDRVAAELEARKDRSAWGRGVNAYALELVEELKERATYEGRNPEPGAECREWMLNGAQDWAQYSWGGSSLIYDSDIAERLCTPSELKKTRNGERRPNSREEWLDTQARALYQACNRVSRLYRSIYFNPRQILVRR